MQLNPFESRPNDFDVKDAYTKDDYHGLKTTQLDHPWGSYEYLLKCINTEVEWKSIVYAGGYQGELYCLGVLNNKYYYVSTGYGSCSGCDWYQANEDNIDGLQNIQDELKRKIREFDNIDEFLEFINKKDGTDWYDSDELEEFITDVKEKYCTESGGIND